jgi:hypothetical protein
MLESMMHIQFVDEEPETVTSPAEGRRERNR